MSARLVLLANADGVAEVASVSVALYQSTVGGEGAAITLSPPRVDDLARSASTAGSVAYKILVGEGIVRGQLAASLRISTGTGNVAGRSADLMFALAILLEAYARKVGPGVLARPVAATGALDMDGNVLQVARLREKLDAATSALPASGFIFFPASQVSEVDTSRYLFYLGTIWSFVVSMIRLNGRIQGDQKVSNRHIYLSNLLLASGDTAMFLGFLAVYLIAGAGVPVLGDTVTQYLQLLLFGVFSMSITMSIYYLFLAYFLRDKYGPGRWGSLILILAVVFFVLRILLHYNPANIWFSMMLPPGQPNYSAWVRNAPLFIYGLLAVVMIAVMSFRQWRHGNRDALFVLLAMLCLVLSFVFYAIDVFASHVIPKAYIWITYTLKTLAYMGAFILLWYGEFYRRAPPTRPI